MRLSVAISCMKDSLYGGALPHRGTIAVWLQQKCSMNFLTLHEVERRGRRGNFFVIKMRDTFEYVFRSAGKIGFASFTDRGPSRGKRNTNAKDKRTSL